MLCVPYEQVAAQLEDASIDDVAAAIARVMGAVGLAMDEGRILTVAIEVLGQGWKKAEIREAARYLANDPELGKDIVHAGTLIPGHFNALREGRTSTQKDEDGTRIITIYSGYALKVKRSKLYSYHEAIDLWRSMGSPGRFSDSKTKQYIDSRFTVLDVEGETWFRLK